MKTKLYTLASSLGTLSPLAALAHSGHESDGLLVQILHHEHLLFFALPTLIVLGSIALGLRKRADIKVNK